MPRYDFHKEVVTTGGVRYAIQDGVLYANVGPSWTPSSLSVAAFYMIAQLIIDNELEGDILPDGRERSLRLGTTEHRYRGGVLMYKPRGWDWTASRLALEDVHSILKLANEVEELERRQRNA